MRHALCSLAVVRMTLGARVDSSFFRADDSWLARGYDSKLQEEYICSTFEPNPSYVSNYEGTKVAAKGYVPWKSTDTDTFINDVSKEFGGCKEKVTVRYLEKAVGDAGNVMNVITGRNYHSAVRLNGCGKTLLLQLQRSFDTLGLNPQAKVPFNVSWGFPVTAPTPVVQGTVPASESRPTNRKMWWSLMCKGRDRGNGVFILYKVESQGKTTVWPKEKTMFTIPRNKLGKFFKGVLPLIQWWNIDADYNIEDLWFQTRVALNTPPRLLRVGLTCDSFSFWFLAMAASYTTRKPTEHHVHAKFNVAAARIVGEMKTLEELTEPQLEALYLQWTPQEKGDVAFKWLGVKGLKACTEIKDTKLQQQLIDQWKNPHRRFVDRAKGLSIGRRGPKDSCAESVAFNTVNMRKYSPWRFWHAVGKLGEHLFVVALDWEVEVFVKYQEADLIKYGKVVIPAGLPKGPWCTAQKCKVMTCGSHCPWSDPQSEAPEPEPAMGKLKSPANALGMASSAKLTSTRSRLISEGLIR